ncbi:MAG: hypothetical protein HS126_40055 [Anaerolineales bacterium]|nr:hypothetical protein [Anaerolineales bacterium]
MATLVPHLTGAQKILALNQVLQIASEIVVQGWEWAYQRDCADALAALASHLTDDMLFQAFQVALVIDNVTARAHALIALAPHLTDDMLFQAFQVALVIDNVTAQAQALIALAPHLTDDLLDQALQAALDIQVPQEKTYALAGLASHLTSATQKTQALQAALDIRFRKKRLMPWPAASHLTSAQKTHDQGKMTASMGRCLDCLGTPSHWRPIGSSPPGCFGHFR